MIRPHDLAGRRMQFSYAIVLLIFLGLPGLSVSQSTINVQSYGAIGNGVANDTAAINRAIAAIPSAGGVLSFPCGTYFITGGLSPIQISNVTVTGPSTQCVTIKAGGSAKYTALTILGIGLSGSVHLLQDAPVNSTSFEVATGGLANLGIKPGDYVLVSDQPTASNGVGSPLLSTQQVVKVTATNGDIATIESSFAHSYTLVSPLPSNQGGQPYVQKINAPVHNVKVTYLKFDGAANTSSGVNALEMSFAVNSEIGFVSASNFKQAPGPTEIIYVNTGYSNNYHDITCQVCGNGGTSNGHSFQVARQSLATFSNITVVNTSTQHTFAVDLGNVNRSTLSSISVDQAGADGRPLKLLRSNYNTFTDVTAKNSGNGKNGINITDISTYNTFNNCVALNNSGVGIKSFGNFNEHNVFNNCTSKYNTGNQFGQGMDAFGNYGDYYNAVNGGTYCCARGGNAVVSAGSNYFTINGVALSDDKGMASDGLVIASENNNVQSNTFTSFGPKVDVYVKSGLASLTYCSNQTPDGTTPAIQPQNCATASACDLNRDGSTNVIDVQLAINQVLGVVPCGDADLAQAGSCTAADVQRVINASLGGTCKVGP